MASGKFADRVVMITGASSGIGEALAREMARQGALVSLLARRADRLSALAAELTAAGTPSLAVACDVTRDGSLEAAVKATRERFGRIDVVVANAGFGVSGNLEALTLEDFRRQFETNVFGVLRTLYAALPELKKSRGCVAIIGSVSGYLSVPGTSAYAMSKFAVRALADAITDELRPHGVGVVLISPGFVESEIRSVGSDGALIEGAVDPAPAWLRMPREKAARQIASAIAHRRREQIITLHGKFAAFVQRHAPWLVHLGTRYGGKIGGKAADPRVAAAK